MDQVTTGQKLSSERSVALNSISNREFIISVIFANLLTWVATAIFYFPREWPVLTGATGLEYMTTYAALGFSLGAFLLGIFYNIFLFGAKIRNNKKSFRLLILIPGILGVIINGILYIGSYLYSHGY